MPGFPWLFQAGSETSSSLSQCGLPQTSGLNARVPPHSAIFQAMTHLKTLEHLIHQVLDLVLTELHAHDLLQVCLHEGHHQVAARHEGFGKSPKSHPAPGPSAEEGQGARAERRP